VQRPRRLGSRSLHIVLTPSGERREARGANHPRTASDAILAPISRTMSGRR